jgi:hypothetical protein
VLNRVEANNYSFDYSFGHGAPEGPSTLAFSEADLLLLGQVVIGNLNRKCGGGNKDDGSVIATSG